MRKRLSNALNHTLSTLYCTAQLCLSTAPARTHLWQLLQCLLDSCVCEVWAAT
jgi:hypothetical protein